MQSMDSLVKAINTAWAATAPSASLTKFHTAHPLSGMENISFAKALNDDLFDRVSSKTCADIVFVNQQTTAWCTMFFEQTEAGEQKKNTTVNFLEGFAKFIEFTLKDPDISRAALEILRDAEFDALVIIEKSLNALEVRPQVRRAEFVKILKQLPGWTNYVQLESANNDTIKTDYLAMRLCLKAAAKNCFHISDKKEMKNQVQEQVKSACEMLLRNQAQYHSVLIKEIVNKQAKEEKHAVGTQFVFCADNKLGSVRKQLEKDISVETQSMIGFSSLAAVLESYTNVISQAYPPGIEKKDLTNNTQTLEKSFMTKTFSVFWNMLAAPFRLNTAKKLQPTCVTQVFDTTLQLDQDILTQVIGEDLLVTAQSLKVALDLMGIRNFSDRVILCGHTSTQTTTQAIDTCGACSGYQGIHYAQLAASLLNNPLMRKELILLGVTIPMRTKFFSAEYDARINHLMVKSTLGASITDLQALQTTIDILSPEKIKGSTQDWAGNLGLISNAALVIGPRAVTKNMDFDGQAFIQSYLSTHDKTTETLTHIMQTVVPRATIANAKQVFSDLFAPLYGSYTSFLKDSAGGFVGVEDYASVSTGSVSMQGELQYLNARLLTVVVCATESQVKSALEATPVVKDMVKNKWISLLVVNTETHAVVDIYDQLALKKVAQTV